MSEQEEFEFRLRLESEQSAKPLTRAEAVRDPRVQSEFKKELLTSPPVALFRGLKDIVDTGAGYLSRLGGADEQARVRAADAAGKAEWEKAAEGKVLPHVNRFMGNMATVAPIITKAGGAIATVAPRLGAAVTSGGMSTGAAPVGALARAGDMGIRVTGGAAGGFAGAGMVDPSSAGTGAAIGAALPPVVAGLGRVGAVVGSKLRNDPGQTKTLADALGVPEAEAARLLKIARSAPDEIVPGSKLTFAQALEIAGESQPGVKMLERTVSGGPGGDRLLKQYADQAEARMALLKANGAQTYQGAAAEEATKQGDKMGAILRTQAGDEKAAAREAWESVYGRMALEDAKLYLPLDELGGAMRPLGPGTVGAGKDAAALVGEARKIGMMEAPAITATKTSSAQPKTLAQAVRSAGGLNLSRNEGRAGELVGLRGDLKNLVFNRSGLTPNRMAEQMHEAGYIPENSIDSLIDALKNDARSGPQYSTRDLPEQAWMAAREAEMGAPPGAEAFPVPVPFDAFQRLRRSAGALGAKVGERAGGEAEAGVLSEIQRLIAAKADDAAAGRLLPGEFMSPGAAADYNAARGMTRDIAERYKGGNAISSILRKPQGQDYTLTGDEIFRKLWHGGGGLAGDVSNFRGVLSGNNREPAMDALRQGIMTEAASKTTAAGTFGAALPKYVESRMPGLQEAMRPEQLKALKDVASDIRNAEAAGSVAGLRGSDTQAKITRALDAGLIDGPLLKTLSRVLTFKGVGMENLRNKVAEAVAQNKGAAMAEMLATRGGSNALMQQAAQRGPMTNALMNPDLQRAVLRGAPLLGADR